MIRPLIVLGCAAALCGCSTYETAASADLSGGPVSALLAPVTADYILMAGAGDLFEIESSRIALERSARPDVRAFAQMMIDHHTRSSATLKEAVLVLGLAPPPSVLPAAKLDALAMLRTTPAADFDRAYLAEQLAGHGEALDLHRAYAANGAVDPLKRVVATTAPLVESHLARAQSLAR